MPSVSADYRARYYSPTLQRFISEDPSGFRGGINRYAYANNGPTNFRDPGGKQVGGDEDLEEEEAEEYIRENEEENYALEPFNPANLGLMPGRPKCGGDFDFVNPGPLPPEVANSFRGGRYRELYLTEPMYLPRARVWGGESGENGRWYSLDPQIGGIQSIIDYALPPGNSAQNVNDIFIPAGSTIFAGEVGSQGGSTGGPFIQIYSPGGGFSWPSGPR